MHIEVMCNAGGANHQFGVAITHIIISHKTFVRPSDSLFFFFFK